MTPTTPEAIDRLLFKGTFVTCCRCMSRKDSKHEPGIHGDAAFARELYDAGWRITDETNTICPWCVKWRNTSGFKTIAVLLSLLTLPACAATRSELSVEVRSQEERPTYSIAMKVSLP